MRVSFAILAFAAAVSASSGFRRQAAMPACAMQCIMNADLGNCDQTDNTCLCKSQAFVDSTYSCIATACQGDDLNTATAASRALCAAAGVTLTQSAPASATPTGTPTGAGQSSVATSHPSSSSATAAPSGSPNSNGAVGPAGISGMAGTLAAVAGFMFAL
ncbi:hypothetical protein FRC12_005132 [Ceratobasidium sp. 428]|nr:hypothetical protein FRC12_005132 [Ceratobasidium sp. 428]